MIEKKSWEEFKNCGLLWFINTILHTFGWAICIEVDSNEVVNVYPARVKFRGFSEESQTNGYIKLSEYMKENADVLLDEAKQ